MTIDDDNDSGGAGGSPPLARFLMLISITGKNEFSSKEILFGSSYFALELFI